MSLLTSAATRTELFVIKAQQVQQRGVQIVDAGADLDGLETELIRGAIHITAFQAAAGVPAGFKGRGQKAEGRGNVTGMWVR